MHAKTALLAALMGWPLAQVVGGDALAGNAGWVGTGLLGAVLSWLLLKHLPGKDAQLERLIDGHKASVQELARTHDEAVRTILADKSAERKEQLAAYREECGALRTVFEREQSAQRELHTQLYAVNTKQHGENTTRLEAILQTALATRQAVQDAQRCQTHAERPVPSPK